MDINQRKQIIESQQFSREGVVEGAWTPLLLNLLSADVGHVLDKGPATFADIRKDVEPAVSDDMIHQFLDALVQGGKIKKAGEKYMKESVVAEDEAPKKDYAPKYTGDGAWKMTMAQWKNIHRDYKGKRDDGTRCANTMCPKTGATISVPVEIIKSDKVTEGVPEDHQTKIAIQTLKMNDVFARIMGGMDKDAARKHLKAQGWSDARIAKLEGNKMETVTFVPRETLTEATADGQEGAADLQSQILRAAKAAPSGELDINDLARHLRSDYKRIQLAVKALVKAGKVDFKDFHLVKFLKEDKEHPVAGVDVPGNYYEWPHVGWWKNKESIARNMSVSELHYARLDCDKAARSNPAVESKYRDEGSIYAQEMRRRGQQKECSIQDTTAKLLKEKVNLDEAFSLAGSKNSDRMMYVFKTAGADALGRQFIDEPENRPAIAFAMGTIAQKYIGPEKGSQMIDLLMKFTDKKMTDEDMRKGLSIARLWGVKDKPEPKKESDEDDKPSVFSKAERDAIVNREGELGMFQWFKDEIARREKGLPARPLPKKESKVQESEELVVQSLRHFANMDPTDAGHDFYHGVYGYQLSQQDAAAIVGFYDKLDAARRTNYQWHDIPAVLKLARRGKLEAKEIKVYAKDRKTVVATVGQTTTSIGASKAAGAKACEYARVDGEMAWVCKESKVTEGDMDVANTIRSQIPAGVRMNLGARDFVGDKDRLQFRVGGGGQKKMVIILDPSDTYTVQGWKWRKKDGLKDFYMVKEFKDVYVEDLPELLIKLNSILHGFEKADEE